LVRSASSLEPSDLFSLQAQITRLAACSPDERIRFFVVASALERLATKLDRSEGEARAEDYRHALSLIERTLMAGSMAAAEPAMVELIDIVHPRSRPDH
jgi:hypothetical protein